jgi:hypothetical protein
MAGTLKGRLRRTYTPLAVSLFFLFLTPHLFAQARYTVESIQFIPQEYYVGDRVELRVVVRASSDVRIAPPREFPAAAWGDFHDAHVLPRDNLTEIHIFFTPYQTGAQTVPNLNCGDVVLQGLSLSVRSLTEDGPRDPAPPRGNLLLPSTRLIIAAAAGLLIVLPLAGIAAFVWLRPWLERLAKRCRGRQPYRKLKKTLAALRGRAEENDSRHFYISLLDALKLYMTHHGGESCMAFTTRELEAYFARGLGDNPDRNTLLEIFHFGDEVKFGGRQSPREKRLADISRIAAAASRLEHPPREDRHAHL